MPILVRLLIAVLALAVGNYSIAQDRNFDKPVTLPANRVGIDPVANAPTQKRDAGAEVGAGLSGFACLAFVGLSYFLPAVVAVMRGHHNGVAIAVLNVLLGWTFLGWVAALVWAFTSVDRPGQRGRSRYDD